MNTVLTVVAILIALGSLAAAVLAAQSSQESAAAADRSASAAEATEHRNNQPKLSIALVSPCGGTGHAAAYKIRNEGPQDLDEIVIYRPRTSDGIIYQLATYSTDWADDEITLGPIALTEEKRFTLSCGHAPTLPEFLVRVRCHASDRPPWEDVITLPDPRTG